MTKRLPIIKIVFLHGLAGSKNNFEYLEQEFPKYPTISFDLIGFGKEVKPKINYALDDFMKFLDQKLQLSAKDNIHYIFVGHSLGALLSKEVAKKYPHKIEKIFLLGYPFLENNKAFKNRQYFGGFYVKGVWWTRVICEMRIMWKMFLLPFILLFRYKYRKSYIDYFKHTYQSAFGTIHNTIFKDRKDDLYKLFDKVIIINGEKDMSADIKFGKNFKQYIIKGMGHIFFGFETRIAQIVKSNI